MDKELISLRFHKTRESYHNIATVQKEIVNKLIAYLTGYYESTHHKPENADLKILEIGCGSGFLSKKLIETFDISKSNSSVIFNDITDRSPKVDEYISQINNHCEYVKADAETYDFGTGFDVIASSSVFQWFKDQERFFRRCDKMLKKDGILIFSSFLPENMIEIRKTLNIGLNYYQASEIKRMLGDNYKIHVLEREIIKRYFDTPTEVLKHMKKTGVNGITEFRWTPTRLSEFKTNYEQEFSVNGKVSLTYAPVYIIAQKIN